ncbi:MAG: glutamyl-tRNA reductase [Burkholderiales bacterium]|nr:glutamyl-tRNA reductase [Burkholderiales bacterium]
MSVLSLSLSHHHAPLDLRGRFAFAPEQLPVALRSLRERLGRAQPEVTLLSTCNRTELYVAPAEGVASEELVCPALDWLAEQGGASGSTLRQHTRVAQQVDAARHAFRVAAGLDSMVLGEPQILGQIKLAVREAGQAGTMGSTLHQLFQRAFSVAKEVRTATDIGAHSVSMSAAAVRLAQQLFGDLSEVRVLFVGAGEMIELAAAHFAGRKPKSMTVANRTPQRGEALARRFGCEAVGLADLPQRLHQFDVVVSCTASTLPIIGLGAMESALRQRRRRPMFLVDLAVPRDIEPEVARLQDVYLYTVDDLSMLVQAGGEKRQAAVAQAEAIVDAGVRSFAHWLEQRHNVPLIREVNARADAWRDAALSRARRRLARGEDLDAVLESLARGLTAKVLHGTLSELRHADEAHRDEVNQAVSRLFLRAGTRSAAA